MTPPSPSIAGLIAELRREASGTVAAYSGSAEVDTDLLVNAADALEKHEQSIEDLVQTVRQEKEEVARLSTDLAAAKGALEEIDYLYGGPETPTSRWISNRIAALQSKVETP